MSSFISIRDNPWQCRNTNISKRDLMAVSSVAPKYVSQGIDVFEAARLLRHHGFISQEHFRRFLTKLQSCEVRQRLNLLMVEILSFMSFECIVRFLRTMKQYDFAKDLWETRYGDRVYVVQGSDIGVSEDILTYYSRTKCFMDDNIFIDRKTELERRFNDLRASLAIIDDIEEKSAAANKFAVVTFLRVPQYREKSERESILEEMKKSIPCDVDTTFSDIIYYAKMATTAAYAGETSRINENIKKAHLLADNCQTAFIKVFVHHEEQKLYRILWSSHPDDDHLKRIALSGQLGLDVLNDLPVEEGMIWRKVFLSESAMSLLKVKNTFDIIYSEEVNENDRCYAQKLINTLERSTSGSECRREMVKYLCKARINELENITLAQTDAEEAQRLAFGGSHFPSDLENIARYNSFLLENTQAKHSAIHYRA